MGLRPKGRSVTPTPSMRSALVFAALLGAQAGLVFGLLAGAAAIARNANYQACERAAAARGERVTGCSVFLEVR